MRRIITNCMRWLLVVGLLHANGQTVQPTIARNGYASGEHATFRLDGEHLSIRYGSDRSGLGIATDWYAYAGGAWRAVSKTSHPPDLPAVHLGECDRDDALDISNHFPRLVQLLPRGSKLKQVEPLHGRDERTLAISSMTAPKTQTGSILQISLLSSDREAGTVLATADIGEARFCSAQWNAHKDGTRDLIVFTLQPAGSSVSYAFQSFTIAR